MTFTAEKSLDILARTIFGEARGEGWLGKLAVGFVVLNRAEAPSWWGKDIVSVCLKSKQFSCWNLEDPNSKYIAEVTLENDKFRECYAAACLCYDRRVVDPTNKATHYYATYIAAPSWAKTMQESAVIEHHKFYREK